MKINKPLRIRFPIMKVFPKLIATEIASVQPMSTPNNSFHYLEAKYNENK